MKKSLFIFSLALFLFVNGLSAQNQTQETEDSAVEATEQTEDTQAPKKKKKKSRGESQDDPEHWPTIKELSAGQFNKGAVHNWGATWGTITRIQKQEGISNFVWKDRMLGLFYEVSTENFKKYNQFWSINFVGRMAVYYPYRYRFRDVPQLSSQFLLYNFDWFLAPKLTYSLFDRVRFDFGVGLHMAYQLSDKFHLFNMGIGAKMDFEFPVSSRWTILMGGMFSWDNGNLGTNGNRHGNARPFDYVYEYQVQFGARYSKKHLNPFSYIKYKPKPIKTKKVRKIETASGDIDFELDLPPEVLEEYLEKPAAKVRKIETASGDIDFELDLPPEVLENPAAEEPVAEVSEEAEPEQEVSEPKVKEKKQKVKKEKKKKSKEAEEETVEEVSEEAAAPEVEPEPVIPANAIRR